MLNFNRKKSKSLEEDLEIEEAEEGGIGRSPSRTHFSLLLFISILYATRVFRFLYT